MDQLSFSDAGYQSTRRPARREKFLAEMGRLPDETTFLNLRRFLEKHNLSKVIFDTVNKHLED
ncbi:hypothetical protein NFC81_14840 [Salinispirillum sp. LH 10-3-1]|uniref:Transposase n=1 Tax=Salinispirillum sp. LH 10-3-1 TaxID=2952525 RepID=A0AB38YF49_9GAMM